MRLTPGEAIRKFCIDCAGSYAEVETCGMETCNFYRYRLGKGRPSVKTIRKECLSCMGGSAPLVRGCKSTGCFVYEFRLGKNPAFAGRKSLNNFTKKIIE